MKYSPLWRFINTMKIQDGGSLEHEPNKQTFLTSESDLNILAVKKESRYCFE